MNQTTVGVLKEVHQRIMDEQAEFRAEVEAEEEDDE